LARKAGYRRRAHKGKDGVVFRRYRGKKDLDGIAKVMNESWRADLVDAVTSASDIERDFRHATTYNPRTDMTVLEADGVIIGYGQISCRDQVEGYRSYFHLAHLLPEWRGKGIRETILKKNEERLREIAAEKNDRNRPTFESYACADGEDWQRILKSSGYKPGWHLFEMVCRDLEHIPTYPLPNGIEIRPAEPAKYKQIWDATREAMRDEKNFIEQHWSDEAFKRYLEVPWFTPKYWQIAWEGDQVVGGVHNMIDEEENLQLNRKWMKTEEVFVRKPWRGKGIAKALLGRSLEVVRDAGMQAAVLDVDTDNPSGALNLYEKMGYREEKHFIFYRKPVWP